MGAINNMFNMAKPFFNGFLYLMDIICDQTEKPLDSRYELDEFTIDFTDYDSDVRKKTDLTIQKTSTPLIIAISSIALNVLEEKKLKPTFLSVSRLAQNKAIEWENRHPSRPAALIGRAAIIIAKPPLLIIDMALNVFVGMLKKTLHPRTDSEGLAHLRCASFYGLDLCGSSILFNLISPEGYIGFWKSEPNMFTDVNIENCRGATALFYAILGNSYENLDESYKITKRLIRAGANIHHIDKEGRTPNYIIKYEIGSSHHASFKKLRTYAKLNHHERKFKLLKLLGHVASVNGEFVLSERSIEFGGLRRSACTYLLPNQVTKNLTAFANKFDFMLGADTLSTLVRVLEPFYNKNISSRKWASRYNRGEPILIDTGYIGHGIFVLMWDGYFIIGNRHSTNSFPINKINIGKKFVERLIESLLKLNEKSAIESDLFYENLRKDGIIESANFIPKVNHLPFQTSGNCAYVNLEYVLYLTWLMEQLRSKKGLARISEIGDLSEQDIEPVAKDVYANFHGFRVFQILRYLGRLETENVFGTLSKEAKNDIDRSITNDYWHVKPKEHEDNLSLEKQQQFKKIRKLWDEIKRYFPVTRKGTFECGRLHGEGKETLEDGTVRKGTFKYGFFMKGKETLKDGTVRKGTFMCGSFEKGKETLTNGTVRRGEFQCSRLHGEGIETLADGTVREGLFSYGHFQG